MKLATAALAAFFVPAIAHADTKLLHYQYNQNVVITISNIPCPLKEYAKDFPYAAVASRIDGQRLIGCFNKEDESNLKIQWQNLGGKKGDFSVFPADAFTSELKQQAKPTL